MSDAASADGVRDRRWLILGVIGLAQLMVILQAPWVSSDHPNTDVPPRPGSADQPVAGS